MRSPLILRPPRAATTMPTAAHTPRACVMCESYPASVAPERREPPPGHRAPARYDTPPGDAAAPWTPRQRVTPAAHQRRRRPLDTVRQRGASRAPDLRCPLPTRPAMATPCAQQSTAHPFVLIALNNSTNARQSAHGAQAHSWHSNFSAQAHVHSQRPSAVSHVLSARPRASSLRQWGCARCASPRLLSRGLRSRRPRSPAALRGASRGHGLF